jgi:hypothetical protein
MDSQWRSLDSALQEHAGKKPQPQLTTVQVTSEGFPHMKHHADDRGFPHFYPETHFLTRGDVNRKEEIVEPGFLQVLTDSGRNESDWTVNPPKDWTRTSFNRARLANWITDPEGAGQLAARVMVNRLWQHHFGRGIVATPNDFGTQGEPPTHPELLDWLARDLIENGWRLKRLHKLMMTSPATSMKNGRRSTAKTPSTGAAPRSAWRAKQFATPCCTSPACSTRRCTARERSTRTCGAAAFTSSSSGAS